MNNTWCIVANAHAGRGKLQKRLDALCSAMDSEHLPYQLHTSSTIAESVTIISSAIREGFTAFLSVGGDGSHHHLVNHLIKTSTNINFTLAAFSAGSGNDWVRTHGIPDDPAEFVQMLKARKTIVHSVGSVEYSNNGTPGQRHFINVAGMLLDAHVVREFPDGYKKIPLIPMYLFAGLWHLFMYRPVETVVTSGERTLKGKFLTIHAGICRYSGGGMRFVPHANPTGNTIAVTCILKMPVIQHLLNTWRLYNGSVLALAKATGFESSAVRIESPSGAPVPVEADGEFLGYTPVTISMTPAKLQVVVP